MEEKFGQKLKQYRKEHYMTQKQLADLIGVSANHIGTLENGKKKPRASTIAAFEEAIQKQEWTEAVLEDLTFRETDQMAVYTQIWSELKRLDPEKERDVLETFFHILDWMDE